MIRPAEDHVYLTPCINVAKIQEETKRKEGALHEEAL